jgi:hemolysin III
VTPTDDKIDRVVSARKHLEVVADRIEEVVPKLRGVSHAWAFWIALAAAVLLVAFAPSADARVASAVYGVGLCALFAGSALYHRWRWDPRWRPLLRRIDHSTIFVFIAASNTPVALLVLDGTLQAVVLIAVWAGALAGVVFSLAWITAPRVLTACTYLLLGWMGVMAVPEMLRSLDVAPLVLLAAGGALYTVGAVVYALQRPNPWPRTFGFHEIFHAFVIAAAVSHFVAISGWVVPSAA